MGAESLDDHLADLLTHLEPDCVLDVGANVGQFGEIVRRAGYHGWIVSFEPCAEPFELLAERAGQDGRWRALRIALGDADGARPMKVATSSLFSSFRPPSEYSLRRTPDESPVVREEHVEVRRLDSCWETCLTGIRAERVFLKVDTQGFDLDVVRGAGAKLDRVCGLQVEGSFRHLYDGVPHCLDTLEYLRGRGFEPTGIFPVIRDSMLRLIEVDCVLVRADGD
ncbi:MAG: FkbM family methyltransferase [Actinomycetota bacterium]|nr:FkbM family methyltransferase [Actinomycetota bacterium]